MMQSRQAKRYLRQIKRLIPSNCIGKKDALRSIRHRVDAYFTEHPDTNMSEFMQEFGTPEELAESFLDEMPGAALMTDLNRRRCINICIGGSFVLIAALLTSYAWYVKSTTAVGIIETLIIYEDTDESSAQLEAQDPPKIPDENEHEKEQTK